MDKLAGAGCRGWRPRRCRERGRNHAEQRRPGGASTRGAADERLEPLRRRRRRARPSRAEHGVRRGCVPARSPDGVCGRGLHPSRDSNSRSGPRSPAARCRRRSPTAPAAGTSGARSRASEASVCPGLAHLLADGTLDTAFVPPMLGQVRALALDAGRLYVGGVQALYVRSVVPAGAERSRPGHRSPAADLLSAGWPVRTIVACVRGDRARRGERQALRGVQRGQRHRRLRRGAAAPFCGASLERSPTASTAARPRSRSPAASCSPAARSRLRPTRSISKSSIRQPVRSSGNPRSTAPWSGWRPAPRTPSSSCAAPTSPA